jgi:hypothetical protein
MTTKEIHPVTGATLKPALSFSAIWLLPSDYQQQWVYPPSLFSQSERMQDIYRQKRRLVGPQISLSGSSRMFKSAIQLMETVVGAEPDAGVWTVMILYVCARSELVSSVYTTFNWGVYINQPPLQWKEYTEYLSCTPPLISLYLKSISAI